MNNKGYILLEQLLSLALASILIFTINSFMFQTLNIKIKIEDKMELQQQAFEINKYIEDVIGNSKEIIAINTNSSGNTTSIKCRYKDDLNSSKKNKEISFKADKKKIFINTLNSANNSESGGEEIGDYVENIKATLSNDKKCVNIKISLKKNETTYKKEFNVYIRNFKGDTI
jgi:type II secretory pathway component PulJ